MLPWRTGRLPEWTYGKSSGGGRAERDTAELHRAVGQCPCKSLGQRPWKSTVIDPQGEYTALADRLGGRTLAPGRPGNGINPFAWPPSRNDAQGTPENLLPHRINMLTLLLCTMTATEGRLPRSGYTATAQALADFYRRLLDGKDDTQPDMEGFLSHLEQEETDQPGAVNLARDLRRFLETGGAELTQPGWTPGQEPGLTTFNLRDTPPALKTAAAALCIDAAWQAASQRPAPRVLIMDETAVVTRGETSFEVLASVVRRARKFLLAVMTMSQDTAALTADGRITGRMGQVLLHNSACRIALRQDPADQLRLARTLTLDQEETRLLQDLGQGQGLALEGAGPARRFEIKATIEELALIG